MASHTAFAFFTRTTRTTTEYQHVNPHHDPNLTRTTRLTER